jgi:16S rRNA C967 or C1407 C5-methylase (RsmB/RsmF family)/NOL1/NOP2/fmu family ribosome biogenesis protein
MNLPEAFKKQIESSLGEEATSFYHALKSEVPNSIRINKNKYNHNFDQYERVPWCDLGRYLPERPVYTLDPAFHAGSYYVQEASSMLLAQAVKELRLSEKPLKVLDLCAAPGGKTTLLHDYLHPDSVIVANEVIKSRAQILKENCIKWGCKNVIITSCDPSHFAGSGLNFDLILTDAPCSGEGMFRKDPESINEWSPESVHHCSMRQKRILEDIIPCLNEGGYLIYSTCTYNDQENTDQINWLCNQHHLNPMPLLTCHNYGVRPIEKNKGTGYQCYPHLVKGEGFFLSVLQNPKSASSHYKVSSASKLRHLSPKEVTPLLPFIEEKYAKDVYLHPLGDCYYLSPALRDMAFIAQSKLNLQYAGVKLGSLNKSLFIPDHALALSSLISINVPVVHLEYDQALSYLRRTLHSTESECSGWQIAVYQGFNIGWFKQLVNRINNYYPVDWRIRIL